MADTTLHIRDASPAKNDAHLILAAFDSALPHLNATGSARQWGTAPLSTHTRHARSVKAAVYAAAAYTRTGAGSAVEAQIAEVNVTPGEFEHVEGGRMAVAAVIVKDEWWPGYVAEDPQLTAGAENWAYIYLLISDFRAGDKRTGAGAKLMAEAVERARARGRGRVYVDCWSGNERRLVKFYEAQGFVWVADFVRERPEKEMGPYDGALLKMEL